MPLNTDDLEYLKAIYGLALLLITVIPHRRAFSATLSFGIFAHEFLQLWQLMNSNF